MKDRKQIQEARQNTHARVTNLVAGDLSMRGYRFRLNSKKKGFADLIVETSIGEIEINVKGAKNAKNWVLLNPPAQPKNNQYYAFGALAEPTISYLNHEHVKELLDRDTERTSKRKEEGFKYSEKWKTPGFPYVWTRGYDDLPK